MSQHTALRALREMNGSPSYLFSGRELKEGMAVELPELQRLATADPAREIAAAAARQGELLASYGFQQSTRDSDKPFAYSDGVAIIPIHGMLINRFPYSWGFATGYNFIRNQTAAAVADDDVKLIVYDVDSPGGLVGGCSETADVIFASRSAKPSLASIDDACHSAAYFLASQASKISVTPSGMLGNIGCIMFRWDYSEALTKSGIKVTAIFSGEHKAEGFQIVPLTEGEQNRTKARVAAAYSVFVSAVARGRGMSTEAVIATKADQFTAEDALQNGLADVSIAAEAAIQTEIGCLDDVDADPDEEDDTMPAANSSTTAATVPAVPDAAAQAAAAAAQAATTAAAVQAAATAERTRIMGILGCAEAKDKPALAQTLAGMDMTLEAAQTILKAAAPEKPVATGDATNPLAAAMAAAGSPDVGDGGQSQSEKADELSPDDRAKAMLASHSAVTGAKHPQAGA